MILYKLEFVPKHQLYETPETEYYCTLQSALEALEKERALKSDYWWPYLKTIYTMD